MINKDEIKIIAAEKQLSPQVIEKDYVLGWVLAGINHNPVTNNHWIFKGGTCLKKCYFETYRFSEDLDFTYRYINTNYIPTENELITIAKEISNWVYDNSGIEIPETGIGFEIVPNKRGSYTVQGKLSYRGVMQPDLRVTSLPRIKIDLTLDEPLILQAVTCNVEHLYSDKTVNGIKILAYSCEEIFAEKIRALIQRLRSRDLYDVIHLYRSKKHNLNAKILRAVLLKKCSIRNISFPNMEMIETHINRKLLESEWEHQLKHQLPTLPPFNAFLEELPEIFSWIETGNLQPEKPRLDIPNEITTKIIPQAISTFISPTFGMFNLEKIRFAAVNRLLINLKYNGHYREIEPYSFAKSAAGDILLCAIKAQTNQTRAYRLDRIEDVEILTKIFAPRYEIEITSGGELPIHMFKKA